MTDRSGAIAPKTGGALMPEIDTSKVGQIEPVLNEVDAQQEVAPFGWTEIRHVVLVCGAAQIPLLDPLPLPEFAVSFLPAHRSYILSLLTHEL